MKFLLPVLALGDVLGRADHADERARVVEDGLTHFADMTDRTVGPQGSIDGVVTLRVGMHVGDQGAEFLAVVRVDQCHLVSFDREAGEEFLDGHAVDARELFRTMGEPVRRLVVRPVAEAGHPRRLYEVRLALTQLFLGPLALGDVGVDGNLVAVGRRCDVDLDNPTGEEMALVLCWLAVRHVCHDLFDLLVGIALAKVAALGLVAYHCFDRSADDHQVLGDTEPFAELLVEHDHLVVLVGHEHAARHAGQGDAELGFLGRQLGGSRRDLFFEVVLVLDQRGLGLGLLGLHLVVGIDHAAELVGALPIDQLEHALGPHALDRIEQPADRPGDHDAHGDQSDADQSRRHHD